MSHAELIKQARSLPVTERLDLIDELIESVESESSLTSAQKAELDLRYQAYLANPKAGEKWEVVRERIRGSLNERHGDRSA